MEGFEILSKLGDGAYSIVYKVKRIADNKIYALKKVKLLNLSEKEKQNALNEVRILASAKSNFVIAYKEAFIDEKDPSLCIIMEYADRGDLYQKIRTYKKMQKYFNEVDVWRIFIQMVKGLKALHDLKILHRDLKSANIFLFSDGSAKLGDLNVSKVAKKGLGYTQTGTPYYASPEVWKDSPYDSKSDIWSLGCVTYEMLTLKPPFRAENMEGLYNKVIKGQFSKIPDKYSKDIFEVVKRMLKVNSNERPSCAQILRFPEVVQRIDFFKAEAGLDDINLDNVDEAVLLRTIRIPKNILGLSDKLPEPAYEGKKLSSKMVTKDSLPEIKQNTHQTEGRENTTERTNPFEIKETNKTSGSQALTQRRSNTIGNNDQKKKQEKDLPSVNRIKKRGRNDVGQYLKSIEDVCRLYVPHLEYSINKKIKLGGQGRKPAPRKGERYYQEIYQPKKPSGAGYSRVIPNKKLRPIKGKKSL